ncbi:MAG TPA: glycosyl hydrolase family 79 C-terminal domain-containing protein [Opitutaceae bacterium]|nr:glycosyl hydrolase family 79 C-terminal domain-containing protein [Opitutaceae bacterium]
MSLPGCRLVAMAGSRIPLLLALALAAPPQGRAAVPPESPVVLTIETRSAGAAIPVDFSGLSFESQRLLPDKNGWHYFSPENRPLVDLFRTLGVKSLRVGGNTSDNPAVRIPGGADIDSLFAFARAAGAKVIYTLRLKNADPADDARIAKSILARDKSELACFAIGNEPNVYAKPYPVFHDTWAKFMAAITAPDMAPEAVFCGPCTTPGTGAWAADFARDFAATRRLAFISQHSYPGGNGRKVPDPAAGRDEMLSPEFVRRYEKFYQLFVPGVQASGLPYRLEETNNFFNGGAEDVSDTYASALWGLDYMWWWAEHGAAGLNFHTGDKVAAADASAPCRYAVFLTSPAGYAVHPLGYAMKAFALGSRGRLVPADLTANKDQLNLTAYGVLAADGALCVTLINKEHGAGARDAAVTLAPDSRHVRGRILLLTAPGGDVAAKTGLRLGGAPIRDDGSWDGVWTPLPAPSADGSFIVKVPAATAAVIELGAH